MKIAIILGTRPEIIKMSPIIRECEKQGIDYYILHTGQHYSYKMDKIFFEQLKLPQPKYNLDVGSGKHGAQTAKMLAAIEEVLITDRPDIVLVQGDTNTVIAGALAASKLQIKIGHVEAGPRSFDRTMPEETNRIIADHTSDYLFTPTETSKKYLLNESIPLEKIFITGNTVVDAAYQNLEISKYGTDILNKLGLEEKKYFLVTVHRAENVDSKERLGGILNGLLIAGSAGKIIECARKMMESNLEWENPYGDGNAAELTLRNAVIGCNIESSSIQNSEQIHN